MIPYIIGFVSGIVSGLGIGGGTILIPAFVLFSSLSQQTIQSINLLYFIPTGIIALIIHFKNKLIDYKVAIKVIIFGIIGSIIGSNIAINLDSMTLKKIFGVFLLVMGIYEIFGETINTRIKKYFVDIQ